MGTISPAKADGAASTRNIILGAATLAAGVIVSNNVAQKNAAANTIYPPFPRSRRAPRRDLRALF